MPQLSLQQRAELDYSNPYLWHLGSFNERQSKFNAATAPTRNISLNDHNIPLNNNLLQIEEEVPKDRAFEPKEESK